MLVNGPCAADKHTTPPSGRIAREDPARRQGRVLENGAWAGVRHTTRPRPDVGSSGWLPRGSLHVRRVGPAYESWQPWQPWPLWQLNEEHTPSARARYSMRLKIEKIGMYSATIIEPTTSPRKAIIRGSMSEVRASVVASTSSS